MAAPNSIPIYSRVGVITWGAADGDGGAAEGVAGVYR